MTGTPLILAELLADCNAHGIRLALADGGGLEIDAPQGALTPDLIGRLKAHKGELLAILRPAVAPGRVTTTPAAREAEPAESRPGAVPEAIRWEDCLDPPDPCPECGTLELWQTLSGNWRCLRCDPPIVARRLAEIAERIRWRKIRKNTTGRKGQPRI